MKSLFQGLITSKTRINILMRLFLNPSQQVYLRELAGELSLSPSQVKEELRQLSEVGLLSNRKNGRQINYKANTKHPLFPELHSMVKKAMGMNSIVDNLAARLGDLELALLLDDYAEGRDTGIIDLLLVGEINQENLRDLTTKTERYIERKIRTLTLSRSEYEEFAPRLADRPQLLLWERERTKDTESNQTEPCRWQRR
ncbi:MAG: ArsR family transcriptional regulator [Desulfurivibrionaceae bacterium]